MDNHATTRLTPRGRTMLPYFTEKFGMPPAEHSFGWAGEEAVETSRSRLLRSSTPRRKEIIFTSGATESDNLMIKGIAEMFREKGNHIITQAIEHKAVLDTCKNLEKHGFEVTYLPVQRDGRVSLDDLKAAIRPTTILITIMYANNEIGVINPIAEIGKIAKEHGIFFAVDGVQAVGRFRSTSRRTTSTCWPSVATRFTGRRVLRSLCSPPNPACSFPPSLMRRPRARHAFWHAERAWHRRLGKACEIAQKEMPEESARMLALRTRLQKGLEAKLDEVFINGSMEHRLPTT